MLDLQSNNTRIFPQDNAQISVALVLAVKQFLLDQRITVFKDPPSSPDLVPYVIVPRVSYPRNPFQDSRNLQGKGKGLSEVRSAVADNDDPKGNAYSETGAEGNYKLFNNKAKRRYERNTGTDFEPQQSDKKNYLRFNHFPNLSDTIT
ncbi:hypothetical protein TNCV_1312351 [Trichonephila clavipes]|nr:hypothetical protein TNCV_1312351 [Trichonephila clavipes]